MQTTNSCQARCHRQADTGAILMVVLIVMIALLGLGMTGLFLTSGSIQMNTNINLRNQALVVAEAGIERARGILNNKTPGYLPPVPALLVGSTTSNDEVPTKPEDCQGVARGAIMVDSITPTCATPPCQLYQVAYPSLDRVTDLPASAAKVTRTTMGTYTVFIRQDQADCRMRNYVCDYAPADSNGVDAGAGASTPPCAVPAGAPSPPNGSVVIRSEGVASDGKTRVVLEVTMTPSQGSAKANNTPIQALCAAGANGCDDNSSVQTGIVVNSSAPQTSPPSNGGTSGGGGGGAGGAGGNTGAGGTLVSGSGNGGTNTGGSTGGSVGTGGYGTGGSGTGGSSTCPFGTCASLAVLGVEGIWDPNQNGHERFSNWLIAHNRGCGPIGQITDWTRITPQELDKYSVLILLDMYHSPKDRSACTSAGNIGSCLGNLSYPDVNGNLTSYMNGSQPQLTSTQLGYIDAWMKKGSHGIATTSSYFYTAPEVGNVNSILAMYNLKYGTTDSAGHIEVALKGDAAGDGVDLGKLVGTSTWNGPSFDFKSPVNLLQLRSGVPLYILSPMTGTGVPVVSAQAIQECPIGNASYGSSTSNCTYTNPGCYVTSTKDVGYYVKDIGGTNRGRVVAWADEWLTYDTVWDTKTNCGEARYQPDAYWNNVVTWLGQCD